MFRLPESGTLKTFKILTEITTVRQGVLAALLTPLLCRVFVTGTTDGDDDDSAVEGCVFDFFKFFG